MIFSVVYLVVRCLLGCLKVLARREVSKDAELLVLRHENAAPARAQSWPDWLSGPDSRPNPAGEDSPPRPRRPWDPPDQQDDK